ncbi:MAG: glycogen synthase [Armatimonadetes bacterium]|nr:glycogen synthase [Candidatus Hippobium faecium]
MKILFVTGECLPYIKTGGLADVLGAVPKILAKKGHDVSVILPAYSKIDRDKFSFRHETDISVNMRGEDYFAPIYVSDHTPGVKTYLVGGDQFFDREKVYGEDDDRFRFIYFNKSVMAFMDKQDYYPDIVHCHDWHAGLLPVYIHESRRYGKWQFGKTKTVFTIHNLGYQGRFGKETLYDAGLDEELFNAEGVEYYGDFSFMKGALVYSDKITTVSPTYAKEILMPENGFGLDGVLRSRQNDLCGIINGLDYNDWGPENDLSLPVRYSVYKREGKAKCKEIMQKTSGLPVNSSVPVFTLVSRLAEQKGFDILVPAMRDLLSFTDAQFIFQGTGEKEYEMWAYQLSRDFRDQVRYIDKYSENMARMIYGSGDIFLMPSRYEPCGLGQMIALTYGNVPLAAYTGGLCDTVFDYDLDDRGNGFLFSPITEFNFRENLWRVYNKYMNDKENWEKIVDNAFRSKFTWDDSVSEYEKVYEKALNN